MSMSMSSSPEGRDATFSPPLEVELLHGTDAPSAVPVVERLIPCAGSASTFVRITLEVELTVGKTDFSNDLEQALTTALLGESYTFCDPRRRLNGEKFAGIRSFVARCCDRDGTKLHHQRP
jgi:hypothetical protein